MKQSLVPIQDHFPSLRADTVDPSVLSAIVTSKVAQISTFKP